MRIAPRFDKGRNEMARSTRILFIGNSYTQRNDLPGLLTRLAASAGDSAETDRMIANGMALKAHWNKGEAGEKIRTGGWDYVVLQERSDFPWKSPARMRESVLLFDPLIRESGAKTVLYQTWAKRNQPENQAAITETCRAIGEETGALVAPVGEAWRRCREERSEIELHDADMSHPTLAGSALAACVFFSVLFETSPVGSPAEFPGLSEETVRILQEIAWETCRA
jgi:hypothetical protein